MPRRSLWRHPDFLKLWIGDTVSQFGSQITALAVPLAAAIVLQATPAEMGFLAAAETLPFLLVSLPAGAWVDRLRRRPVLISGDLVRAVALLAVPITAVSGHLSMPVLYAVALVTGTATVFFDVAYMSYLPSLVDRDQLVDGNSKLELSRSAAQFAGPGIAGALVGWLTASVAILFDAISFLFSAVTIWLIRKPEPAPETDPSAPRRHIVAEIREGLGVVLRNPVLRAIAASIAVSNLFTSMGFATLILFLTRDQGLSAIEIGLAFGLANLGAIAGALVSGRIAKRLGVGRTLIATDLVGGLALLAVPLASPAYALPALVVGFGISSLLLTAFNIVQVSLRQSITPDRLQGRMNATMRFFIWGVMPIGSLLGGGLATVIGIREAILFSYAASLAGVLPLLLPPLRSMRQPPMPPMDRSEG
jgi:MFS family permease